MVDEEQTRVVVLLESLLETLRSGRVPFRASFAVDTVMKVDGLGRQLGRVRAGERITIDMDMPDGSTVTVLVRRP